MAHKVHVCLPALFPVILLYIVTIVAGTEDDRSCPHYGSNFRGRCFWFVNIAAAWSDAGQLCHRLYGDHVTLVTIKDKETNDFIRSQSHRGLWIGLHEAHGETVWRWVDNTEPANGNYQNWENGAAPTANTGNRNCGLMKRMTDLWTDADCGQRLFFVCAELPSAPICSNGGIFFRDRCYWPGTRQLTWEDANQACQDEFGPDTRLAVARDAETNLFLSRLAGRNIWLGLSDRTEEGVWKWIDGTPFDIRDWLSPYPPDNSQGIEDCVEIVYPNARWNAVSCGYHYQGSLETSLTMSYICAVPPCLERTGNEDVDFVTEGSDSNEEVRIVDNSICARTECTQRCVNGGVCNSTGQCVCVQQFPGMTCNIDDWKVEMETEIVRTTTGSTLNLKCKTNLPVDHISSLTWTKCDPGFLPLYRHNITRTLSQGYSTLQVSGLVMEDAGQYSCKAVLNFRDIEITVAKTAVVYVTEASNVTPITKPTTDRLSTEETRNSRPIYSTNSRTERTTLKETQASVTTIKQINNERTAAREFDEAPISTSERISNASTKEEERTRREKVYSTRGYGQASPDESKYSAQQQPNKGHSALIVILFIMTTLLLLTVVVLVMKMRRMGVRSSEDGKLIELQENSSNVTS